MGCICAHVPVFHLIITYSAPFFTIGTDSFPSFINLVHARFTPAERHFSQSLDATHQNDNRFVSAIHHIAIHLSIGFEQLALVKIFHSKASSSAEDLNGGFYDHCTSAKSMPTICIDLLKHIHYGLIEWLDRCSFPLATKHTPNQRWNDISIPNTHHL